MTRWWRPPAAGQTVTGSVVFGDVVQIMSVGGDVTVSLDRPPYRVVTADDTPVPVTEARARAQPSRLLLARHQVVPFTGRERTLDALAQWMGGQETVAALLVHGAGGQGKTRLASHVSILCTAAGWTVWQVTHTPSPVAGTAAVSRVELPGGAVLAVVDYADRWPASALLALLTQLRKLHTRAGTRVRVLMLARSRGYWWPALADRADSDPEIEVEVDQMALPPLAADSSDDRTGLFTTAAARFASVLNVRPPTDGWSVPDLAGDGFGQVLAVHMAALAAVDAARHGEAPPTQPPTVSAYLLRREQAYWQHLHTRAEAPVSSPPEVMHRAVVAATLTGAQLRSAAGQALQHAGFADTTMTADRIVDDHTTCYPPVDTRTVFEPLHPDRLGEDLIALSVPGHGPGGIASLERDWTPAAIIGLLTSDPPPVWAANAVTVLVEAARRWPHIATDVLYPLIREDPRLMIAAGGATITRLTGIPGVDLTVLQALEPLLPVDRHIDLDIAAAAITTKLTQHRLAHTNDQAERARLHDVHAKRLAYAGEHDKAMDSAEEATKIYRQLAEADPAAYQTDLARSLHNLSNRLAELGCHDDALAPAQEAVNIRRRLAATEPAVHQPDLALSLNSLNVRLAELGRRDEALAAVEEAVDVYRHLAEENPAVYQPDLAMSLNNLGIRLADAGRRDEALDPTENAKRIYEALAEENPAVYQPDLAMSLNNLGIRLADLGRHDEALDAAGQAVSIRRQLAEKYPAAFRPDLAASLDNLATSLAALGRHDEALDRAEQAVSIRRRLADTMPAAHQPGLAGSLYNLGNRLAALGRLDDALPPAENAVSIYRRLADANPAVYHPVLAMSLNNLGIRLADAGRRDEALGPATEAKELYEKLAEKNPAAFHPDLAMSLDTLGNQLAALGRFDDALPPAKQAVSIRRELAEKSPAVYQPDLAASLNTLSLRLAALGRHDEALNLANEANEVHENLAEKDPAAYRPGLAMSLNVLGNQLATLGRLDEALGPTEQAVSIYRQLADTNPAVYQPGLAMSLNTLGNQLAVLGRFDDALPPVEQAVSIYRHLVDTNPAAYQPGLAMSLATHACVCLNARIDLPNALKLIDEAIDRYEPLNQQFPQGFASQMSSAYRIRSLLKQGIEKEE